VGCTPHRHRRGRRKRGHSGGLHATSLLKREKKVTTRRWVACHIVIEEEEESNDTACGLHAASSLKREKKAMTWRVDCTPHRRRSGRRKQRHSVWIACHIIVEVGKESNDTAVVRGTPIPHLSASSKLQPDFLTGQLFLCSFSTKVSSS